MESYISPPEDTYLPMLEAEREIKGVQLLSVTEGHIEQSTSSRNQEIYWKRDFSTVVIGREPQPGTNRRLAPNSFVLPCPVMSREHAIVHMEGNQVFLTDSASHHGTWRHVFGMNNKVEDKLPVLDGDIFIFGKPVEKNGQIHQPATVTVKFAYSDPSSNLPARHPTVDPDDRCASISPSCSGALAASPRFDSYHYTKSNRYGLDDNDLEDDDDDDEEDFEYDRESDHASSFEDNITYDAPIRIDDESPPRRFSSSFYSYQSHSPRDRSISRSPSIVEIPSVQYQRHSPRPASPRDPAISRSPSIVEIPSVMYHRNPPGPAMGDIRISPELTHLPPSLHSPSSNVPPSGPSLPPYSSDPPYFNSSPPSSSVNKDDTFPSETQNFLPSFTSSTPPPELSLARDSFASEPHSDPNANLDSHLQVVAASPEFHAEIFERMEKLKGLQVGQPRHLPIAIDEL
ncbi:hypothetical protein BS47DRAFT_35669 [Hydnum rufescens UP504]|uniref:FHA domain-containing protein n=1 Tax=Hydnum rufescens UP504 TaxID=1448309 RepID=A0A9P6AS03_9AGAM|nr:hypothetical protein BS47DRAFT_35669 [Hydnum rufescens UP504]